MAPGARLRRPQKPQKLSAVACNPACNPAGVLVSWLSSLAFYATPSPHTAALPATSPAAGGGVGVAAPLWAWSALPVLWLLALLAAWEWSAVSGAVATWYDW